MSLMQKEFAWHEGAFASIAEKGYVPQRYGYIWGRELRGDRSAYLMADGNHRISALAALGSTEVVIKLPLSTAVIRQKVDEWPLVRAGEMTQEDALIVFDAYLNGNASPARSEQLADLIG
ncbi:hypothetical protein [Variovorax arabinosiphilus]|nr:hypothetical protein [Variovorax sp. J2R1-6]MDM0234529.1 hypothetical protein [Variovorax sp. J2R1-6]